MLLVDFKFFLRILILLYNLLFHIGSFLQATLSVFTPNYYYLFLIIIIVIIIIILFVYLSIFIANEFLLATVNKNFS